MKEQNLSKKKSFIKKFFIKICRLLGYEIIDQGNFFVPTQNKFINENLNAQGIKSINLPLGEIKISRDVKTLTVIFRSCTKVNMLTQTKKRLFDKEKSEYTFRSLNSLRSGILSVFIGTLTLTGSFIAFGKLQGFISGQPIVFKGQQILNAIIMISIITFGVYTVTSGANEINAFYAVIALSALIGITLTIPIGGADMPVVISLLNSYSGIAASATGFVLMNNGLIIAGALVGASGLILTNIMCKGMNRSLSKVIFGAVGLSSEEGSSEAKQISIKSSTTDEAAMILDAADKVIVVPGYGLAVAQAQHAVREVAEQLESMGQKVLYAIHPVAGRMPGHMNVLLAEANIPYELLKDLDEINPEFEDCDVAIVLGANDVVNPAARHDSSSPIFGMPILDVDKSRTVIVNKRTMNPGFAGIQNELFGFENTVMVFGDAKEMLNTLHKDLKEL